MDRTIRRRCARATFAALALWQAAASHAAPSATLQELYDFSRSADGNGGPWGELAPMADGRYAGVTCCGGAGAHGTIYATNLQGTTRTLHAFAGSDGWSPNGPLVQTADGNLYGTAYGGGRGSYGTVYRLAPDGGFTVLHAFTGTSTHRDGEGPEGGLLLASDGNFYGTTVLGGRYDAGTVFRITPAGDYAKLADVDTVGSEPTGMLTETADHRLVGVTSGGGLHDAGALFSVGFDGSISALYEFELGAGPAYPKDGPIDGGDGWLYGTSSRGGPFGDGTVYRVMPDGTGMTVLHAFTYQAKNGDAPWGRLVHASNGLFYGTTQQGGIAGHGTVFQVSSDGRFAKLAEFDGAGNGTAPSSGLVQVGAKKLLGAVPQGGPDGRGDTYLVDLK